MKKLTILFLVTLLISSCATIGFSVSGDKEKQFVSKFLTQMQNDPEGGQTEMMKYLSKRYLTQNKIDGTTYDVNYYSLRGFSIESYSSKGFIKAKIWGEDRSWIHMLTFKLIRENGSMYFQPSKHSDAYVHPWWEVEQYIND